jgi:hypothetical protein
MTLSSRGRNATIIVDCCASPGLMPHLDRGSRPFQEGAALLRFRTAVRSVSEAEIMRRMAPAQDRSWPAFAA